jgi:hypothetical protein
MRYLTVQSAGLMIALATSVASAAPVTLDSEQKAADGVNAAFTLRALVPLYSDIVVYSVTDQADRGLKMVAAATSFEALLATKRGISINCPNSGSLSAKMADSLPRVLKLQWNDCAMTRFGAEHTFSGPLSVTLQSDSLRPERVSGVQMGNADMAFEDKYRNEFPDQIDTTTDSYRVSLRGDLSWTRAGQGCCQFLGSSSYEVNGSYQEQIHVEYTDGTSSWTSSQKIAATRMTVIESKSQSDAGDLTINDFDYMSGALAFSTGTAPSENTEIYKFNDYRIHEYYDYTAWTSTVTVDGKVNASWAPSRGPACTSGLYSFRTRSPIVQPLGTELASSGELVVNGDVNARFFSPLNVPRKLPAPVNGMLLNMRVHDVGTFNYDTDRLFETLHYAGQCLF